MSIAHRKPPIKRQQRIHPNPDRYAPPILLPYDAFYSLVEECRALNIDFLSTPFDLESLDFLVNDLRVNRLKIPSGEMTNGPLLWAAGRSGPDIVMSTGMCTLGEIQDALSIVSMGYAGQGTVPDGDLRTRRRGDRGKNLAAAMYDRIHPPRSEDQSARHGYATGPFRYRRRIFGPHRWHIRCRGGRGQGRIHYRKTLHA